MAEMNTTTATIARALDITQEQINILAGHGIPATLLATMDDGCQVKLHADRAVDLDLATARDGQRIAGALECLSLISAIEEVAERMPEEANNAAVYYDLQAKAGINLVEAFGPMTPRQEGALRALGEYVHQVLEAGTPCLDLGRWKPTVALSSAELQAVVAELAAA